METSVAVAWWGAICGSLALTWDAIKWFRSGARLKITAATNMRFMNAVSGFDETLNVIINVRNVGDKPTTITHFLGYTFENKWKKFIKKPKDTFFITSGVESPIPFKLEPGGTWSQSADQNQIKEITKNNSLLYLGVQHSVSDAPVLALVEFKKEITNQSSG